MGLDRRRRANGPYGPPGTDLIITNNLIVLSLGKERVWP